MSAFDRMTKSFGVLLSAKIKGLLLHPDTEEAFKAMLSVVGGEIDAVREMVALWQGSELAKTQLGEEPKRVLRSTGMTISASCAKWLDAIRSERVRQTESEGYSTEHDMAHNSGELAWAAAYYATPMQPHMNAGCDDFPVACLLSELWPRQWPLSQAKKSRKSRRRQLVVAAALILAELERLEADPAVEIRKQP